MLHSVKNLQGLHVLATNGPIGSVRELYFDDERWTVRYLVVDTGSWLPGRHVLITPIAVQSLDLENHTVSLNLTKEQVQNSPDIDTNKPVSRQQEAAHFRYYGYPYYWGGSMLWGPAPYPAGLTARQTAQVEAESEPLRDGASATADAHLRHTNEVIGYNIQATDGELGHVADFLVDPESWTIRYFVVGTSNWWFGNRVLVSPGWITEVRWLDKKVSVDLTQQAVKASPPYDESTLVDRPFEAGYYAHHRREPYWPASTLVSLNDHDEFEVAPADRDPRGWEVAVADGHRVGKVDDLLLDTSTMKVRYLDIDLDPGTRRTGSADQHILLPVKLAQIGETDRVSVARLNEADLARVPAFRSLPLAPDYDEQFLQQVGGKHAAPEQASAPEWSIGGRRIAGR